MTTEIFKYRFVPVSGSAVKIAGRGPHAKLRHCFEIHHPPQAVLRYENARAAALAGLTADSLSRPFTHPAFKILPVAYRTGSLGRITNPDAHRSFNPIV